MSNLTNLKFKGLFALILLLGFSSCEVDPITVALHNPIHPSANQSVEFTLEKASTGDINSAELFEIVSTINSSGVITTSSSEVSLQSWTSPTGDLSFTKSSGYPANSIVSYRWEVRVPRDGGGSFLKTYDVNFATRPYPVTNEPAPVYVQGDVDDLFDVVFIPDTDISSLATFRTNCRSMIKESFFDEPTSRLWRKQYNFYINPFRGTATDFDNIATDGLHQVPSNNSNLAFAEGRCLMHQNNLRDYASGGLFSTEMQNRGTILHESGHALFDLADEYSGGSHFEDPDNGNMWNSLAEVQDASDDFGDCKSLSDINNFDTGWWKLCDNQCQMLTTGLNHTNYDCPCRNHIHIKVLQNASN